MNAFKFTNGMIGWHFKNHPLKALVFCAGYPLSLLIVWVILSMPLYLVEPFCKKPEPDRSNRKEIDYSK